MNTPDLEDLEDCAGWPEYAAHTGLAQVVRTRDSGSGRKRQLGSGSIE